MTRQDGGVAYLDILWGLQFGNFITRHIKSKHLFIDMFTKNLGL